MQTIKVQHSDDHGNAYRLINAADYDPKVDKPYDDDAKAVVAKLDTGPKTADREADRLYEANRGVPSNAAMVDVGRNPSGTFSEPTPTNVNYPNKDATEFENNHGAHIGKSASALRKTLELPDVAGGLYPQVDGHPADSAPVQPDVIPEQRDPDVMSKAAAGETVVAKADGAIAAKADAKGGMVRKDAAKPAEKAKTA